MRLVPLPAFADNYIWLLADDSGNAVVVDPGEADVVRDALDANGLRLHAILLTHHHADHTGGVADLLTALQMAVYAPEDPRMPWATQRVADGDTIELDAPHLRLQVLAVPGHTRSHVAYFGAGLLFCGDTLFSLGCGRMFEGTPAQMLASLDRIAALPPATRVCAAHEYTATNGRFALTVDADNPALAARLADVAALRARGAPTLPVPLGTELATNPFLRLDSAAVAGWCHAQGAAPGNRVDRFAHLRAAKDAFR